jgi:hypothetical protein
VCYAKDYVGVEEETQKAMHGVWTGEFEIPLFGGGSGGAEMKKHIGSTVALVLGMLMVVSGLVNPGQILTAGVITLLGAFAYRSAKKRKLGDVENTKFRKFVELALMFLIILMVTLQNDLKHQIATDPFPTAVIPLWTFIAYSVISLRKIKKPDVQIEKDNVEDPDVNIENENLDEQANIVVLIQAKCKYALCHTEILTNPADHNEETLEYERSAYKKIKEIVFSHLENIEDEFYRGAAIHNIIRLLVSGNDIEDAKKLFSEVDDDFICEKIIEEFPMLS